MFWSKRKSLPMKEFLNDKNSVGELAGVVRPLSSFLLTAISDHRFSTVVLEGPVGVGKSTMAYVLLLKQLDELLCSKDPQKALGFGANAPIHLVVTSATIHKAKLQATMLFNKLTHIKNFAKHRPALIGNTIVFAENTIIISFENIYSSGMLGLNVVGGIVEADKVPYEIAERVIPALSDRIKSRTLGGDYKLKGVLTVVGGPADIYLDEFTESTDPHRFTHSF